MSRGCANCYARAIYERHGWDFSKVTQHPDKLLKLENRQRWPTGKKRGEGSRAMLFVCDTGDLFHEAMFENRETTGFLYRAIALMTGRRQVDWQILTKRAKSACQVLNSAKVGGLPPHVWLGVSVEDQATWDERVRHLRNTQAAMRFVSVEPMLGPVYVGGLEGICWVIVGAESGPERRPFDPAWAKALYEQCKAAGVPFFGKQDSGLHPGEPLLIGGEQVKEFPTL